MRREVFDKRGRVIQQAVLAGPWMLLSRRPKHAGDGLYPHGGVKPLQVNLSTASSTCARPLEKEAGSKTSIRHIFHIRCNNNQNPRIAYCGYKDGGSLGIPWFLETAKSIDCTMCITSRELFGCPRCGFKWEK